MSVVQPMELPGFETKATAPKPAEEIAAGRRYEFFVAGEPRGMGSKSAFAFIPKGGGKPRAVITDVIDKNPQGAAKLTSWKDAVTAAAIELRGQQPTILGPMHVAVTFHLRRPIGHHKPGGELRRTAPRWPATKPDVDKLVRATLDALKVSGLYGDDSRVVDLTATKVYAASNAPTGARIVVEEL